LVAARQSQGPAASQRKQPAAEPGRADGIRYIEAVGVAGALVKIRIIAGSRTTDASTYIAIVVVWLAACRLRALRPRGTGWLVARIAVTPHRDAKASH